VKRKIIVLVIIVSPQLTGLLSYEMNNLFFLLFYLCGFTGQMLDAQIALADFPDYNSILLLNTV
jgi:hypothetical protein